MEVSPVHGSKVSLLQTAFNMGSNFSYRRKVLAEWMQGNDVFFFFVGFKNKPLSAPARGKQLHIGHIR
jgi:hypothetical protein